MINLWYLNQNHNGTTFSKLWIMNLLFSSSSQGAVSVLLKKLPFLEKIRKNIYEITEEWCDVEMKMACKLILKYTFLLNSTK